LATTVISERATDSSRRPSSAAAVRWLRKGWVLEAKLRMAANRWPRDVIGERVSA
jgi:hypothetical protein